MSKARLPVPEVGLSLCVQVGGSACKTVRMTGLVPGSSGPNKIGRGVVRHRTIYSHCVLSRAISVESSDLTRL
jgi:hypothetical protein